MLYCYIVLYCDVLYWMHCIILRVLSYRVLLYYIVLHRIVLYCLVLFYIALYCTLLYCIVSYCIVLYRIVLYYIVSYIPLISRVRGPYGKSWSEFFSFLLWPKREARAPWKQGRKKQGYITCPTDRANKANKMVTIWLCWLYRFWKDDRELEVRTATYGPGIDQSQNAKSVSHIIFYIVLYCILLYDAVLYCCIWFILYCIVSYHVALHFIVSYCFILYCIVLYCVVSYHIVLYHIIHARGVSDFSTHVIVKMCSPFLLRSDTIRLNLFKLTTEWQQSFFPPLNE